MNNRFIKFGCLILAGIFFLLGFFNVYNTLSFIKAGIKTKALVSQCISYGDSTYELLKFKTLDGQDITAQVLIGLPGSVSCDIIGSEISIIYNPKTVANANVAELFNPTNPSSYDRYAVRTDNFYGTWFYTVIIFAISFLLLHIIPQWLNNLNKWRLSR